MVFKLIRTDVAAAMKIQLPLGKHLIGRGTFLDVENIEDKRVSRNHAEIEVTEDSLTLKSIHQNPCFYIKKNYNQVEMLKQDVTLSLGNGDKFGILPERYWYQVIYCILEDDPRSGLKSSNTASSTGANMAEGPNNSNYNVNEEAETNRESDSPSLLEREEPPQARPAESPTQCYDPQEDSKDLSKTFKRLHSDENSEEEQCKKAKSSSPDEVVVKQEPQDQGVKLDTSDGAEAGPSNDKGNSSKDTGKDNNDGTPAQNPVPPRERCMYGANCYRRNADHLAEFSHPRDVDWGEGAKGQCPFGRGCRRRHARHWATHEHPPGTQPPQPHPDPGMRVFRRHGNVFYINANTVHFYDDHFEVEDSEGESVDYDYEF